MSSSGHPGPQPSGRSAASPLRRLFLRPPIGVGVGVEGGFPPPARVRSWGGLPLWGCPPLLPRGRAFALSPSAAPPSQGPLRPLLGYGDEGARTPPARPIRERPQPHSGDRNPLPCGHSVAGSPKATRGVVLSLLSLGGWGDNAPSAGSLGGGRALLLRPIPLPISRTLALHPKTSPPLRRPLRGRPPSGASARPGRTYRCRSRHAGPTPLEPPAGPTHPGRWCGPSPLPSL